jgi:hypothetical protein
MRQSLGIAVIALLIAVAGVLVFEDRIWPETPSGPRGGAGGTAGDNIAKKRTGG